jgi:threonine synthase
MKIQCTVCHGPFPETGIAYKCPRCGGLFDYTMPPDYDPSKVDDSRPGIFPYDHTFGLPGDFSAVSLGEGATPLVWSHGFGRELGFKIEYQNPTGSFKDRGSAALIAHLDARQIEHAVEDSSGNAGASFAAYAARAGIETQIFVPDAASGPKKSQIQRYGAKIVQIMGPRSNAAEAVMRAVENQPDHAPVVYASHAYLPFNIPGYATIAYEIYRGLGRAPGAIIMPMGQGGLLLGTGRGFRALRNAGLINKEPILIGVQARACAPLWALYSYGAAGLEWSAEGKTIAEGIRVRHPLRGDAVLKIISETNGKILAVDEEEILPGRDELAQRGFYVEPTSAVVWGGLVQVIDQLPDPVVIILTGSGMKYSSV